MEHSPGHYATANPYYATAQELGYPEGGQYGPPQYPEGGQYGPPQYPPQQAGGIVSDHAFYPDRDTGVGPQYPPRGREASHPYAHHQGGRQILSPQPPAPAQPSAKMSGKQLLCRVVLLDGENAEIPLQNPSKATGEDLFKAVVEKISLVEYDFFGLSFVDSHKTKCWLQPQKTVKEQISLPNPVLEFEVKFYPPDPAVLEYDFTRWLLCLQVRQDILCERTPCSFMTLAVMGAYTVQSEVGDFDPTIHQTIEYLQSYSFASTQSEELLDRIMELHKLHKGLLPAESDHMFLDNAKKLARYGMDMWSVKSETRGAVQLGISASGVYVYEGRLRVDAFKWPRILKVSYKRNLFFIKVRPGELDKHEKTSTFKCVDPKFAKRLWRLVVESHQFFRLKAPELTDTRTLGFGSRKWRLSTRTLDQMKSAKTLPRKLGTGTTRSNRSMDTGGYGTLPGSYGNERFDSMRRGEHGDYDGFNDTTIGRDYDMQGPGGPLTPGQTATWRSEDDMEAHTQNFEHASQLPDPALTTMGVAGQIYNGSGTMEGPPGGYEDEAASAFPGGIGELPVPLFAAESAGVSPSGLLDMGAPLPVSERGEKPPPIVDTQSVKFNSTASSPFSQDSSTRLTSQIPIVKTVPLHQRFGSRRNSSNERSGRWDGSNRLLSSVTHTTRNQTSETTTYMTERDGYIEKRIQHKITLTSEDGDLNFDQALLDAIQMVTNMDPNLTVEKIEIKTEEG